MSHVFHRVLTRTLPHALRAEGVWIQDADRRRYLDAAGGAIVVNVGHGDRTLVDAMADQSRRTPYVHGTVFTTDALEDYADAVAPLLPLDEPRIYPVSGGSEAVETAIKLARAFHLARGAPERTVIIGRQPSYHGNTLGTLDVGGKAAFKRPYEPWLGRFPHVEAAYEYRCPNPRHPTACGAWHAERLERAIADAGPSAVAAFVAEPVAGATLAAAVPTDDYWPAVAEVCRRHGVLLIADEVMTGFGRTGRWFGMDHWGVRPDVLTAGKGSTGGYLPFGFAACSAEVFETVRETGFVHGFTWSHNGVGAAVAHAALRRLAEGDLVEASARQGERLLKGLSAALGEDPIVGDVRGIGLMLGIELVSDRASKAPFDRSRQVTERVLAAARDEGLLLYSSVGHVDGDGDLVMLGPPFVISDEECDLVVERTSAAIAAVSAHP
jgi:adenosylmethionine-8-amino-7-oxononanoate aminotransferase